MPAIPLELPMRASEAAALADLVIQNVDNRPLSDDLRHRLAARAAALGLETIQPYLLSLVRDPVHASSYYMAVDAKAAGGESHPYLLRLALASSPATSLFRDPLLIGRMRPGGGREVVVNAIAFAATDFEAIRTLAEQVDRAFLPRPQGHLPAIAVADERAGVSLPAAFDAFRSILKSTGINYASTVSPVHGALDEAFHRVLWAAIRAGWREGYSARLERLTVAGESAEEAARSFAAVHDLVFAGKEFTGFCADTSGLVEGGADTWDDSEIETRFDTLLEEEDRTWALDEFSRSSFETGTGSVVFGAAAIRRLAVKFAQVVKRLEDIYDAIRSAKSSSTSWKQFDFEIAFDRSGAALTAQELVFVLHWLKSRGRPVQQVAVPVSQLEELAGVARIFSATLSVEPGAEPAPGTLESIGRATGGKVNYKESSLVSWLDKMDPNLEPHEIRRHVTRHIVSIAESLRG